MAIDITDAFSGKAPRNSINSKSDSDAFILGAREYMLTKVKFDRLAIMIEEMGNLIFNQEMIRWYLDPERDLELEEIYRNLYMSLRNETDE